MLWMRTTKFDRDACALADRHYSRRKVGAPQFMPPGETIVLLTAAKDAVFGWWRPHPSSGIRSMNGLDGWTCTIFRNEGPVLSSTLVRAAEDFLRETGSTLGPDGLLTYVWDARVRSTNPGYCFRMAGWSVAGRSADGRKTLLQKIPALWPVQNPGRTCGRFGDKTPGAGSGSGVVGKTPDFFHIDDPANSSSFQCDGDLSPLSTDKLKQTEDS